MHFTVQVHSFADECMVFVAHFFVCLLPTCFLFVFAVSVFNVRLSEYGEGEFDSDSEGWYIQDIVNVLCVITVITNAISLFIYYSQNRTWGLKELLIPDSRRSFWDTVQMLFGNLRLGVLWIVWPVGTPPSFLERLKNQIRTAHYMQPVVLDSGRFKEVLLDQVLLFLNLILCPNLKPFV